MRVSVRLNEEDSRRLRFLTQTTHQQTSEVVKRALHLYFDRVRDHRRNARGLFAQSGFIASGEGPVDLSGRVKEELTTILDRKYSAS